MMIIIERFNGEMMMIITFFLNIWLTEIYEALFPSGTNFLYFLAFFEAR